MDFTEDQVKLIKDQVAKDSTDNELKAFPESMQKNRP